MNDSIDFFRRFTTLVGPVNPTTVFYLSDPYEVTAWDRVDVEVFLAAITGTAVASAQLQESSDLTTWTPIGSPSTLTAQVVTTISKSNPARYLQLKIIIDTAGDSATLWAKGVARTT